MRAATRGLCDVGHDRRDLPGCPGLARFLLLAGTEAGDIYTGGFWCCGSHVACVVDELVANMLRAGARLAAGYRVAVFESVGLDQVPVAVIRPRRRGLALVRAT